MTELLPNIFAIEVPRGTTALSLAPDTKDRYIAQCHVSGLIGKIPLPPGSYEILFTTKGVSEEQVAGVVESAVGWDMEDIENVVGEKIFKDYDRNKYWFHEPLKSLQSLLKSKGLTAENYLIIKRVEG